MASFEIVLCDPLSVSKRKYVPRIPNQQWVTVKNDVTVLHRNGWKHKAILAYLRSQRGLNPTLGQLGSKMLEWRLFTYRTSSRSGVPVSLSETIFRDCSDIDPILPNDHAKDAIVQVRMPRLQCILPLYSCDEHGNFIPNWSAFLLRAAKGDSLAMKTICILAKSQRSKRTRDDYQLYQQVIEAVRAEMSSLDALTLRMSVMVFYAILALAIQAGFMREPASVKLDQFSSISEPVLHLNAAGHMLGRINMQTQKYGCQETLKQLVDFFNVANYLLALSRCSQSEVSAWPLLMYHLIVQG